MNRTTEMKSLTLDAARQLADTAVRIAEERKLCIHVTVFDAADPIP